MVRGGSATRQTSVVAVDARLLAAAFVGHVHSTLTALHERGAAATAAALVAELPPPSTPETA